MPPAPRGPQQLEMAVHGLDQELMTIYSSPGRPVESVGCCWIDSGVLLRPCSVFSSPQPATRATGILPQSEAKLTRVRGKAHLGPMAHRENRRGRRRDQRTVPPHVHQVCFTHPNPNHGETLSLQEEDLENIVFLGESGLVEDEELGTFTPPDWNVYQPREVQRHNRGLCTNYNTWILYRRRLYRLIVKGRASSADGLVILLKIEDIKKEVDLLLDKITELQGRPFTTPDVLETEMKLKVVGSSK